MIFTIPKDYCDKKYGGSIDKAIMNYDAYPWTRQLICQSFNSGNGTVSDLYKFISKNQDRLYFKEV